MTDWNPMDNKMLAILARHDFLCANPPRCEFCGTAQVQLKSKMVPATWKCRVCKGWFEYEPHSEAFRIEEKQDSGRNNS